MEIAGPLEMLHEICSSSFIRKAEMKCYMACIVVVKFLFLRQKFSIVFGDDLKII